MGLRGEAAVAYIDFPPLHHIGGVVVYTHENLNEIQEYNSMRCTTEHFTMSVVLSFSVTFLGAGDITTLYAAILQRSFPVETICFLYSSANVLALLVVDRFVYI